MTYVLDASAILRFTDQEPGFERVRDLFIEAAKGAAMLLISAVNWGEIVTVLYGKNGPSAEAILGNLAALPMTVVPVDAVAAADAGRFKWRFKVPYADAFAGALALSCSMARPTGTSLRITGAYKAEQATLLTADYDFKEIPKGTIRIEFLPAK
jgi:PIN domain nuclease of toxin-antitoxin system